MPRDPTTCPYYESAKSSADNLVTRYRNRLANEGKVLDHERLAELVMLAMLDAWETGVAQGKSAKSCGCVETYPQLRQGVVSHGLGCRNRGEADMAVNDDDRLPMDDVCVREVLGDLSREVMQRDLDALFRSLHLRGLTSLWVRHTLHTPAPLPGETWEHWLTTVAKCLPVRPVLALLAEAGVLGTSWFAPATDRVLEERGWR